jgi:acylphosphatase
MPSEALMMRKRIVVRGRVQGVGFRYAAVNQARRLGLNGWARNAHDGSVEIVAEGPAADLDAFVAWCHQGPPAAHVTSVEHAEEPHDQPLGQFGVKW